MNTFIHDKIKNGPSKDSTLLYSYGYKVLVNPNIEGIIIEVGDHHDARVINDITLDDLRDVLNLVGTASWGTITEHFVKNELKIKKIIWRHRK